MNRVQIQGHHRSGNHYLAALIELNLFNPRNYIEHLNPAGHCFPNQVNLNGLSTLFICTYRNFKDTLESIFKIQQRLKLFGDWKAFNNNLIEDLCISGSGRKAECEINWHFRSKEKLENRSSYFMRHGKYTLEEWHYKYCLDWIIESERENVIMVKYEDLVKSKYYKQYILSLIAEHLDRIFLADGVKDITERVGYYSRKELNWRVKK